MNEHQPLAEITTRQHSAEVAAGARTPRLAPPRRHRGHQRRAVAGRLRRIADRLDG